MTTMLTIVELNELNEFMAEIAALDKETDKEAVDQFGLGPGSKEVIGAKIESLLDTVHGIVSMEEGTTVMITDAQLLKGMALLLHCRRLIQTHGARMPVNGPTH